MRLFILAAALAVAPYAYADVPTGYQVPGSANYILSGNYVVQIPEETSEIVSCAQYNSERGNACWELVFGGRGDEGPQDDDE